MTKRTGLTGMLLLAVACGGDPGRDVRPMANPLTGEANTASTKDILPLEEVRKSQAAAVSQRIANTEVTINYSRPVARGRELYGALVPYGQIWNPGADQATAMATTRDIQVNGQPLQAGRYSLWVIPEQAQWTVIFNRAADVYHEPYPGQSEDALRLQVTPEQGPHMEALSFYFPAVEGKAATLHLHWGDVVVPLSIKVP